MSKNSKKIQFNLIQKYEEIYNKSVQSLEAKGVKISSIEYEKQIIYSISTVKVKEMK